MKTLRIYVDTVKCQFRDGKMTCLTDTDLAWCRRNRQEIDHYKELTRPTDQRLFLSRCDSDLIEDFYLSPTVSQKMPFEKFYRRYQALHFEKYHKYLEPLFLHPRPLQTGRIGEGLTIFIKTMKGSMRIAHISDRGQITLFHEVDSATSLEIQKIVIMETVRLHDRRMKKHSIA